MNYAQMAERIIKLVGGKENIINLTHCATRLRFNVIDEDLIGFKEIEEIPEVMKAFKKGNQTQVIVGTEVGHVYNEICKIIGDTKLDAVEKKERIGIVATFIDVMTGIFSPFISAITGAGMLKCLLVLLRTIGLLSRSSDIYQILDVIADVPYYFLPFLVAFSASKKFGANEYMSVSIVGTLVHPGFIQFVTNGTALKFIGMPLSLIDYSYSVVPAILGVWLISKVDVFSDRVTPKVLKFMMRPLLTILICAPIILIAIGPVGTIISNMITQGAMLIDSYAGWFVPLFMGGLQPLLVMTGTHYAFIPMGMTNILNNGVDRVVSPGMMVSNIAQGGATIAVGLKTKNKKLKEMALSSGVTATCGITEPSLYGVTLKLKKPLIASMIGGGMAGLYLGIMGVGRYVIGQPGVLDLPGYIGEDGFYNVTHAGIGMLIAFFSSFVITWLIGFREGDFTKNESA